MELTTQLVDRIIKIYNNSDETVSLYRLSQQFEVDYLELIKLLRVPLTRMVLKLKVVRHNKYNSAQSRLIPMGDLLLDYYYLNQPSLAVLAETFGYTDLSNCQRVMKKAHPVLYKGLTNTQRKKTAIKRVTA